MIGFGAVGLFLKSPLGRKVLASVGIALVLGIVVWRIYAAGKQAGEKKAEQAAVEALEEMRQRDKQEHARRMQQLDAREAQAAQREAQAQRVQAEAVRAIERSNERLATVQQQRQQVPGQVQAIPDELLLQYVTREIGLRHPSDTRAVLLPEELRHVAQCVTDWPLCKEENAALTDKVAAQQQQVVGLQAEVVAVGEGRQVAEDKYQAERTLRVNIEGYYVQAYNAVGIKKRSAKCLWVWRCGKKSLPFPAPDQLPKEPQP